MSDAERFTAVSPVICKIALADCTPVNMAGFNGGVINVPAARGAVSLEVWHATQVDGEYLRHYDSAGVAVSVAVSAARSQELPNSISNCEIVKFKAIDDNDTPVQIILKS